MSGSHSSAGGRWQQGIDLSPGRAAERNEASSALIPYSALLCGPDQCITELQPRNCGIGGCVIGTRAGEGVTHARHQFEPTPSFACRVPLQSWVRHIDSKLGSRFGGGLFFPEGQRRFADGHELQQQRSGFTRARRCPCRRWLHGHVLGDLFVHFRDVAYRPDSSNHY